jgi:hypothetical protein
MKKYILLLFFGILAAATTAQAVDSTLLQRDSTPSVSQSKKAINDSFPVPKKALLWAIVPGGGQIYVRKGAWWKAPIVLGGFAVCGYAIGFNTTEYRRFRNAYKKRVNNEIIGDPEIPEDVAPDKLRQARDGYFKQLQQSYIAVGITYLVSAVWAFSDAHLAHFDVNDDLSMRLKPSFEPMPYGNALGIGLNLKF